MWKCIRPSRYCWMQTAQSQKSGKREIGSSFSNTDAHLNRIPRGTSSHLQDYFSQNYTNSACDKAVSTSYPVTLNQQSCNGFCISEIKSSSSFSFRTRLYPVQAKEMNHWNSFKQNQIVKPLLSYSFSVRYYAKGKDRGSKSGKGKSKIDISPEEMRQVVNGERLLVEFNELIENFQEDLTKAVAIRTNVGSLEELSIELEGDTYPLNELAEVHRKSPTLVIINCAAFPQATKSVVTAIVNSGMNLNPQQEGTSIAVPIPKVTREHREGLANKAKQMCNKCKDNLRQVHNNYVRKAKGKEGQVSEDIVHKVTLKIKEMLDEHVNDAEVLLAAKQSELLKSS